MIILDNREHEALVRLVDVFMDEAEKYWNDAGQPDDHIYHAFLTLSLKIDRIKEQNINSDHEYVLREDRLKLHAMTDLKTRIKILEREMFRLKNKGEY